MTRTLAAGRLATGLVPGGEPLFGARSSRAGLLRSSAALLLLAAAAARCPAQLASPLPDAPQPPWSAIPNASEECVARLEMPTGPVAAPSPASSPASSPGPTAASVPAETASASESSSTPDPAGYAPGPALMQPRNPLACPRHQHFDWYSRFVNGPRATHMSPGQKAWLATRNLLDPFANFTLAAGAAVSVAADPRSPYGPGMNGVARDVGVGFTESLTGEFVGTFLIPSLVHQDPHYHRMPGRSIPRRVGHALLQVAWTESDSGRGMPNYANLAGFAVEDEVANLYVPGRQTDLDASASRYGFMLATAPIDNLISEFVPDVARRIHFQTVVIQRIVNHVAATEAAGSQ